MSNGLKGRVREIVTRMDAIRSDQENARDIGLRQFMAEEYTDSTGNPLEPGHLYSELGINPNRTRVKDLMADADNQYLLSEIIRDGVRRGMGIAQRERLAAARSEQLAPVTHNGENQRFMSPDVFLDPVNRGLVQSTFYPDLTVSEVSVPQPTVTVPKIELSDAELKESNEGATIEEGSVTYGSKDVKITKKARALKITYEAIQFNTLNLVQIYFADAGRILGHQLNNLAVAAIADGDQTDTSEAAAVVGVESTTNGITWYDIARVAIQFALIGRTGTQAIGNATTGLDYINLDEVKNKQFPGSALLATMMKSPLTMPETLYVSPTVAADQLIINDPSMSIVQLTAQPLMIETDKIILKQIEVAAASIITGFAKLQRNASVILDGSILYSGNGFPAWMQPYS